MENLLVTADVLPLNVIMSGANDHNSMLDAAVGDRGRDPAWGSGGQNFAGRHVRGQSSGGLVRGQGRPRGLRLP
jgi:hypothetical protein